MTVINANDFIQSISSALQFISYYHPKDFLDAMYQAYQREQSPQAKNAIAQILQNSKIVAEGHRPICQDTGSVCVFIKVGMQVQWDSELSVHDLVNQGVREAYLANNNPLRASIVRDPAGKRINTKDNTPAVIHMEIVPGDKVHVHIGAKGFGSENKAKLLMLNPSDSIVDNIIDAIPKMGAGWCPPGVLGVGIGGSAEKAMVMAKEVLLEEPINMQELLQRGPNDPIEELRIELYKKINALGIGAQGLGGLTTVLDVKIKDYPVHAAGKPVGLIPNCAANRHISFELDGSGPAKFDTPKLSDWPCIASANDSESIKLNIDNITKADLANLKAGDQILLSGKLLTGRDAAHKRIADRFAKGEGLPDGVDFTNRFIYYVGPVPAVNNEVVGPAGPTTATRMDKFTEMMLEKTGLIGMIGKAERGDETIESIKKHKAVYLIAIGGAAYLISKAISDAKVLAFEDLGMEAISEFTVEDMPLLVAVDSEGNSIHKTGPEYWRAKATEQVVKFHSKKD
jgi:fumarate hydratase class I